MASVALEFPPLSVLCSPVLYLEWRQRLCDWADADGGYNLLHHDLQADNTHAADRIGLEWAAATGINTHDGSWLWLKLLVIEPMLRSAHAPYPLAKVTRYRERAAEVSRPWLAGSVCKI